MRRFDSCRGHSPRFANKSEEVSLGADFSARCIRNRAKWQTAHKPRKLRRLSPTFLSYPKPVQFDLKPSQTVKNCSPLFVDCRIWGRCEIRGSPDHNFRRIPAEHPFRRENSRFLPHSGARFYVTRRPHRACEESFMGCPCYLGSSKEEYAGIHLYFGSSNVEFANFERV